MDEILRQQLIAAIQQVSCGDGSEEELDAMLEFIGRNVPSSAFTNFIFYPEGEPSAEEMLDGMLADKPIQLRDRSHEIP